MRIAVAAPHEITTFVEASALGRLEKYVLLLNKWRKITNLISDESFEHIWNRHILDAIHLQRQRPQARAWLDIGSGAGLPGVIIASLLADVEGACIICVEIDRRKCAFLREVASQLKLPLKVQNILAEQIASLPDFDIDVVTARAFSSLERIVKLAEPQLRKGAIALLPRGRSAHDEVARIDRALYRCTVTPNPTPGDGVFVQIELRESRIL